MSQATRKRSLTKRITRIVLKTILWIFLLIVVVFLLLLTPPVQHFITKKATNYLEKKLATRVSIGRLYITLSGKIAIDNFYIEDREKDTLLSAGKLRVDMSFAKLLFGKKSLNVKSILLEDATAKIKRQLPDTVFNFQFIVDAFGSGSSDSIQTSDTSHPMPISIGKVEFNRIRFVYKDIVAGNDVQSSLAHFDTKLEKFDIDKLRFVIPTTNISGLVASVVQTTPLVIIPPEAIEEVKRENAGTPAVTMEMDFGKINMEASDFSYRDSVHAMYTSLQLGKLQLQPKKIDLGKNSFDLGDIALEKTKASFTMGKAPPSKPSPKKPVVDTSASASGDWGIKLAWSSLSLNDIALQYDDENNPRQKEGMDYFHLKADIPEFQVNQFLMSDGFIKGNLAKARLTEQSGFRLDELHTEFLYSDKGAFLKDLYLKTPGSELKKEALIGYASIDALQKDIGNMQVQADIVDGRVQVKDLLTFVPSLRQQEPFSNPNATLYIDGKINGKLSAMKIDRLRVSGIGATKMDVAGTISGIPDMNRLNADLNIKQLSTTRKDVLAFLPKNTIPDSITLPSTMSLTGRVKGGMNNIYTDLRLNTDFGNATVKGTMQHIDDAQRAKYDLHLVTSSVELGKILQDSTYGPVTLQVDAKGNGYDPKTASGKVNGVIQSAVYKKYEYKEFKLNAEIVDHELTADADIQDPNIDFTLNASANMAQEYPTNVKLDLMIDSIKVRELHLSDSVLTYHGKIEGDFASVDPDSLYGKLLVTQSVLLQGNTRVALDTVTLLADDTVGKQFLQLQSDVMYARMEGQYKLTELGDVFMQSIRPYYAIGGPGANPKPTQPYDFTINAYVQDKPLLRGLMPSLEKLNGVNLESNFSNDKGMNVVMNAQEITYAGTSVKGVRLDAVTTDSVLRIVTRVKEIRSGSTIHLDSTIVRADMHNNIIDLDLAVRDRQGKPKYTIASNIQQAPSGDITLSLLPESLMLKYEKWQVTKENKITIGRDGGINASDFAISKGGQELKINSTSADMNAPMDVTMNNFRLSTLTGLFMSDSTIIDGVANGKVEVRDISTAPVFTGQLTVADLSYHKDTVGNVHAEISSPTPGMYNAVVSLDGRGNDARIDGSYNTNTSAFTGNVNLQRLPMKIAEMFSGGALRNTTGYVTGQLKLNGTIDRPSAVGELEFHQAGLNIAQLNNYFSMDQEKLVFTEQGIQFNKFNIKDSTGNPLVLDGTLNTADYQHYRFDLGINANNFRVLNSTKKDNQLFYGQLYITTNLKIGGTESAPSVDGRLTVNDKTVMTVVLPQSNPEVEDREGVVEFVDMSAPASDSLFLKQFKDTLNNSSVFEGMNVSLNVSVNRAADFTLIIDQANGDFLHLKGSAQITTGIDPSGTINMTGTYEVDEGTYELSFNMLKRKFNIEKGSRIVWQGEPTDATVDVTAKFSTKAAPYDLVKGIISGEDQATQNYYQQKIPVDVLLKMEGPLMKPQISFDIRLPDNKNLGVSPEVIQTVRTQLEQLRQTPNDMNKQVFSLLLLNRFVPENPFASSGGSSVTSDLVKQSVSALMADQLNRLAEGLIEGVDINFGIESSDDYTSGERQARTDLNVAVSKRLLNQRLTVTVGSDITLQGEQPANHQSMIGGNISVDYALSPDGRYKIRAYSINDYEGVIDGYVLETGVGFIITLDYNKFKQIFENRKKRAAERKQRQAQQAGNADKEKKN